MKRVGYPEDSTQSAYSSQLIRIPLSAIIIFDFFFFFIFPALFLERKLRDNVGVVIGICYWWGWVLGKRRFWRHERLTHFQTDAVCIRLDDGPSFLRWYRLPALDWYPFVSRRLASRFFDAASERDHCLAGLANRGRAAERATAAQPTSSFNSDGRQTRLSRKEGKKFHSWIKKWVYLYARLNFCIRFQKKIQRRQQSHANRCPYLCIWLFLVVFKRWSNDDWRDLYQQCASLNSSVASTETSGNQTVWVNMSGRTTKI